MNSANTSQPAPKATRDQSELTRRYGKIGISAVAGALACENKSKDRTQSYGRGEPRREAGERKPG